MNVADQITEMALRFPHKRSVVAASGLDGFGNARYVHYTFIELERKINQFANALAASGVQKGDKTLLFVKPCLDFSALAFALFKIGAAPVFIDPGMGRKKLLEAVKNCSPKILIGIPKVHVLKKLFSKWFESVEISFNYGKRGFLGASSIVKLAAAQSFQRESESVGERDLAAILYTSGGTGRPKGVIYTHDIFIAQTKALQVEFNLDEKDVDVAGFPLFALFTLSMGMTSCIPDMDPGRPAAACPKALLRIIKDQAATFVAGSPAIWSRLALHCHEKKLSLPTVKCLVMFGAPVSLDLHRLFREILPNGETYTPYGATESLPVSNANGSEILENQAIKIEEGAGVYIGRAFKGVEIKIIKVTDHIIERMAQAQEIAAMEVGEIVVSSPTTTKAYYQLPQKNLQAKIRGDQGVVWHRMGDVGYLDREGALWFCGRKAHMAQEGERVFYSVPVETVFNQHPLVKRSALIVKNKRPALAVERLDLKRKLGRKEAASFAAELKELGSSRPHTQSIQEFYLSGVFPVDVRHNIKIDRKKLSELVDKPLESR